MQVCRTCMSRYELSPLFGEPSVVKFSSQQLLLATGVKIAPNDGLPQLACKTCIKQISKALNLRELSSRVDHILRNIMAKYKTVVKTETDYQYDIFLNMNNPVPDNNLYNNIDNHDSYNNDNIPLATYKKLIDTKPELESEDDVKYNIKKVSTAGNKDSNDIDNFDNHVKESSDIENFDSYTNDSISLEECDDSKPLIENGKDHINSNKYVRSKKPSKSLDFHNHNFTKHYITKDANDITKLDRDKYPKSQIHCNKQFDIEDVSETDIASGKISNLRIEDFITKDAVNKLFGDRQHFGRDKAVSSKLFGGRICQNMNSLLEDNREICKPITMSGQRYVNLNINSRKKRLKQMTEKDKSDDDIRDLKLILDNRKELEEKNMKLMNLAIKPHPPCGPFRCKICHSRLRNISSFKTHAKTHFEPEFTCENCGKKFNNKNQMYYHQQRMHGKEKRLACTRCSFKAVDRPTLRNHERAAHTGERPYVCDECGAAFRMRNNIIQHLKSHFGTRDKQCEVCSSSFTRRSQLWGHQMKVHFMTYTYHCYLCPETYKGQKPVKRHLLNVHGVPLDQQMKIKCVKTKKGATPNASSDRRPK